MRHLIAVMLSALPVALVAGAAIPMRILGNSPILTAVIDGRDVPVMFDLGEDSALVLTRAVLGKLKIAPTGASQGISDVKGNTIESPTFKVRRLQIGDKVFVDVDGRVDAHDPSYQSSHVGQQGYLGTALLRDYRVVLDYRRGKLTLIPSASRGAERAACRGMVVPFLPEWNGAPVTRARTDWGNLTFVWDTGAPASLLRTARAQEGRGGAAKLVLGRSSSAWGAPISVHWSCALSITRSQRAPTASSVTISSPGTSCASIFQVSDS